MKNLRAVLFAVSVCLLATHLALASTTLDPVAISPADGRVVAAAFSPDSRHLAVVRSVNLPAASTRRLTLQLMDLRSGMEVSSAEVPHGEAAELSFGQHFISYSSDGQHLLIATEGSDNLSVIDANTLATVKQFALHAATDSHSIGGHNGFKGVVSLSIAANSDVFGVMRHDESGEDEVFIGTFSSGAIVKSWSLGRLRAATQLGETALSLSRDGSLVAVSVLSDQGGFPKTFHNLRLYNATSGEVVKSIRTKGLVGQIALMPDESILAARIDVPGLFSKHTCIERWKLDDGSLTDKFCDSGRNVTTVLDASHGANLVVGYAGQIKNDAEGQYFAGRGRVGIWNLQTREQVASLGTFRHYVSVKVSPNGRWILAGPLLLEVITAPRPVVSKSTARRD